MGREKQRRSGHTNPVQLAKSGAAVFPSGNLHQSIEHEERAGKTGVAQRVFHHVGRRRGRIIHRAIVLQIARVGVEKGNRFGAAFCGEAPRLIEKLLGEIESGELAITERPQAEGHATGATTGFDQRNIPVEEKSFDQNSLGLPQSEFVRGPRIVDHREKIIEIGADGSGGNLFDGRQRRRQVIDVFSRRR